ncbi:hypothetical protein FQN52_009052 [Onygenales sp. PD_12]|nr:hypothetical protein FQN52_009052 [Onygenales sp. PD_12]
MASMERSDGANLDIASESVVNIQKIAQIELHAAESSRYLERWKRNTIGARINTDAKHAPSGLAVTVDAVDRASQLSSGMKALIVLLGAVQMLSAYSRVHIVQEKPASDNHFKCQDIAVRK